MKQIDMSKIRILGQCLVLGIFLLMPSMVSAQTPASSPCDPNYYKSLKARAWLEAQREITQNQNLIYKPDSVLQYTCFNKHLNVLASRAGSMFSENPKWGGAAIGMTGTLNGLVNNALQSYLGANYSHKMLGDRSSQNYSVSAVSPGSYSCDMMNKVWMAAKCQNFIVNAGNDGFFTFDEYANSNDKRFEPSQCTAIKSTWQNNIKEALTAVPWTRDTINPFQKELNFDSATSCNSITPVPTGIKIFTTSGATLDEKICIMPGCFYNAVTNKCIPGI